MVKYMKKNSSNKVFSFFDVVCIIVLTSFIMFFLGSILVLKKFGGVNFAKYTKDPALTKFVISYDEINKNYYDKLDKEDIIDNAIEGMYGGLDNYSKFMNEDATKALTDSLNGKYNGIGIKILSSDDTVKIEDVYDSSPAKEAGVEKGDIILSINDEDVTSKNIYEVADKIKNSNGVKLVIKRGEETLTFNLEVKSLYVTSVKGDVISYNEKKVGYIRIEIFNSSTQEQFKNVLENIEKQNIDSLIIDVRQNSGGYLSVCTDIVSMFLDKGKTIYKLKNKNGTTVYKDKTKESRNYKVDILMDNYSASASEILAAALKDSYGARLVGMKSFGKGKVQEKVSISNNDSVKYSTAKWLTPKGVCIDEKGLDPDIKVDEVIGSYDYENKLNDKVITAALNDITT